MQELGSALESKKIFNVSVQKMSEKIENAQILRDSIQVDPE